MKSEDGRVNIAQVWYIKIYGTLELRYFRDIDKREVDFVILEDLKSVSFIELKPTDKPISKALPY